MRFLAFAVAAAIAATPVCTAQDDHVVVVTRTAPPALTTLLDVDLATGAMRPLGRFGLDTFALVELRIEASRIPSVIALLAKKYWLPHLFLCAGSAAIMGIAHADSVESINRMKSEELGGIEGILDVKVSVFDRTYKTDMRWAQRVTDN